MITLEKAQEIVLSNTNLKIMKSFEYKTVYVFAMVPNSYNGTPPLSEMMGILYSVNKKTGAINSFTPFSIPLEEYKAGKEIKLS